MNFNHKLILNQSGITSPEIHNFIELTFGQPYSKDISEQLKFLSKTILTPHIEKEHFSHIDKVLLSREIERDLGATILSIISGTIDTPNWNFTYDKINPATLSDINPQYERAIQKTIQKVMAGLPNSITNDSTKKKLLNFRLSLALNNEMCLKSNTLHEISQINTPDKILSKIILEENEEIKNQKVKTVIQLYENIIENTFNHCPTMKKLHPTTFSFIKSQTFENLIDGTCRVLQKGIDNLSDTEHFNILSPVNKNPPILKISMDSLHKNIYHDINEIYKLCIFPYFENNLDEIVENLNPEEIEEYGKDLKNHPEFKLALELITIVASNLHTAFKNVLITDLISIETLINNNHHHSDFNSNSSNNTPNFDDDFCL